MQVDPPPADSLARIETELGLRDYQRAALRSFVERGGRGIAHMATGTGKTLLGLGAIEWAQEGDQRALVIVPTRALLEQWAEQIVSRTGLAAEDVRIACGSSRFRRITDHAVVLTPIQTAMRNPDAIKRMVRERRRTLLVVDECHRAGAPQFSNALVEAFPFRLGLSATPERPYDPTGTQRLMEYFEGVAHQYDLGEAVEEGHLAKYTYHVHSTYLDDHEREAWQELTTAIGHVIADIQWRYEDAPGIEELGELLAFLRAHEEEELVEELQQYLFARARIVKNAVGKLHVFGRLARRFDDKKVIVFTEEIGFAERLASVARERGLETRLYHSLMGQQERDLALRRFRDADGGVLVAVRALDEGLDVPDADVAVLAASSTSPRQHIQRRGRVLRPLRDRRKLAELHDFYVIGVDDARRIDRIREDADRIVYHGFDGSDLEGTPGWVAHAA